MKLLNIINFGIYTIFSNVFGLRRPLNAMISVTNRCPSRCKYCNIPKRKQKELSTSQIIRLIDELSELGTKRVGLWGGEPLMRDDIGKIIDHAKKRGMFVTLDSNGYLLKEKYKEIKNLDLLLLSFDGNKESHDKNRENGSFDKTIEAIKFAQKKKIPFWTITVLTKNNIDQVDYIIDVAKKYNFFTTFQVLHHSKDISGKTKELLPTNDEYKKAIRKLISLKKEGAPIVSSKKYLKYILNWQDYSISNKKDKDKKIKCFAGDLFFNVDTDGKFYPCVIKIGSENTNSKNFLDVGTKKAFKSIKKGNCNSCTASCLIEYNMMYSLDSSVIFNWLKYMIKTKYMIK